MSAVEVCYVCALQLVLMLRNNHLIDDDKNTCFDLETLL